MDTDHPSDRIRFNVPLPAPRRIGELSPDRARPRTPRWAVACLAGLVLAAGGLGFALYRMAAERQARRAAENQLAEAQTDLERLEAQVQDLKAKNWGAPKEKTEVRLEKLRRELAQERARLDVERLALREEKAALARKADKEKVQAGRTAEEERRAAEEILVKYKQKLSDAAEGRIFDYLRRVPVKNRMSADTAREWLNAIHRAYRERGVKKFAPDMIYVHDQAVFREARALIAVGGAFIPPETPRRETWADAWAAAVQTLPRPGGKKE